MSPPKWSRRQFLFTCGTTVLAGCSSGRNAVNSQQNVPWPAFGADAGNTGHSPKAPLPSSDDGPEWTVDIGGYPYTSPVVGGDAVVVGSESNGIEAFEAASGKALWRTPIDGSPAGTPAIDDDAIFVTVDRRLKDDTSAFVQALNLADGSERWRTRVGDEAVFSPTVSGGSVYVRTTTELYALDRNDGAVRWALSNRPAFETEGYDVSMDLAPAVVDRTMYAPDPDGLVAVETGSGSVEWTVGASKVRAAPTVTDDLVYLADVSDGVRAFDRRDGSEAWVWNASGCWTSPAVGNGSVYATAGFDVVAVDADNGEERWRLARDNGLHGDVYSSPAVGADGVVVGSIERTLAVVREGSVVWETTGGTRVSPALAAGRSYVVSQGAVPERPSLVAFD